MFDFVRAGVLSYLLGIIITSEADTMYMFLEENLKSLLTVAAYFVYTCNPRIPGVVMQGLLGLYILLCHDDIAIGSGEFGVLRDIGLEDPGVLRDIGS